MSSPAVCISTLGFPRIGPRRELKSALEAYWSGKIDQNSLLEAAAGLRAANWARQHALGVTNIPSNDFSLYDHVLDTSIMVGAIPAAYGWHGGPVPLDTYFAMARGSEGKADEAACGCGRKHGVEGVPALEMTKWFDTNYHYMVPEFSKDQVFRLSSTKPVDEYREAKALGFETRPVLLGPVTYLRLGKCKGDIFDPVSLIDGLIPVYIDILRRLGANGAAWVQIDEPCLVTDLDAASREALQRAYGAFAYALPNLKLMLTTYFGGLGDNLALATALPVAGLHLDLIRAPDQIDDVLAALPHGRVLSLGVIDGRNVWRANLPEIAGRLERIVARRGTDHVEIAPSCSLLHVPIDLEQEKDIDPELREWLAFALQKITEIRALAHALGGNRDKVAAAFQASADAAERRHRSARTRNPHVRELTAGITPAMARRRSAFAARAPLQREALHLPLLPTTSIGSFPQTKAIRTARAAHAKGQMRDAQYEDFLRKETEDAIIWQDSIGLDVLVHGEFERNDMVQYFGEQLEGFVFTKHGWVQSYGSRYVRPPILFGDVSRPKPMTVEWWRYAQSKTKKPMKGMLTGPVTILNWSFVRDDLPRADVCRQIGLAIRNETLDLEAAGAQIIQIDEAALREGLPLRKAEWNAYLDWAIESFRLCASGVSDTTQIHTHMCYSEFNDIIDAIAAMDADVISIETSRSKMELLDAFRTYRYPNEIGPGVYDIHSPRVPETEEMTNLLHLACARLSSQQLWVNPDCGLKTRKWEEVRPALERMVDAARQLRAQMAEAAQ
jgi:5-methyltetrahydropteroyltriglutamate--homocysteine methyltransferase